MVAQRADSTLIVRRARFQSVNQKKQAKSALLAARGSPRLAALALLFLARD
jgi:maltodextrin utilization protein YvdJ